jgi:carbon monoxide dehydrogenase subunit G
VATCLPGAEYLGRNEEGAINGKVSAKVGPFQASFEGNARVSLQKPSSVASNLESVHSELLGWEQIF